MGSAFDWSPGGCCCVPWFFDIYSYDRLTIGAPIADKFVRSCSMFPAENTNGQLNSKGVDNWYIEPSKQLSTHLGYTADGKTVWTQNATVAAGQDYLGVYDIATQSELASFTTPPQFPVITTSPTGVSFAAINASEFASSFSSQVIVRNKNGSQATWSSIAPTKTLGDGGIEQVASSAPLDWPHAAIQRIKRAPFSMKLLYAEFGQAELGDGSGTFSLTNYATIHRIDYPSYTSPFPRNAYWLGYDHFGTHSVAIIAYDTTPGMSASQFHNRLELYIDGSLTRSLTDLPNSNSANDFVGYYYQPHVCFPHETLGDGYVAVLAAQPQSNLGAEMLVFKDGTLLWQTNTNNAFGHILGSTDRWIYFTVGDSKTTVFQVTNGEFQHATNPDPKNTQCWIARHDGSQIVPLGTLTDESNRIAGQQLYNPAQFNPFSMARDSTVIPNSLPATFLEMWNVRHDA